MKKMNFKNKIQGIFTNKYKIENGEDINMNTNTGNKLIKVEFSTNSSTRDVSVSGINKLKKLSNSNHEYKTQAINENGMTQVRIFYVLTFTHDQFNSDVINILKEIDTQLTDNHNKVLISFVTEMNMSSININDVKSDE